MRFPSRRSFKPNKTWLVLGIAIVIGCLAALAARTYLSNRVADLEVKARGRNVEVIVAKVDMVKGTKLSSANVAVRPIPVEYAHSTAILPGQFERIEGQALASPVKAGEMMMWGLLEGKKVPTFSARIEAGRRAITVPVDEINSISGMLEPGDLIDLMVTLDQKGKKITVPLMQSVQVMATGQRSVDDPKSGERRLYSTVTLDTDLTQAQNVIVAREAGRLTALLRNPQDKSQLPGGQADLAALLGGTPASILAAAGAEGSKTVPVLYGGSGAKMPPEGLHLGQYVQEKSGQQAGAAVLTGQNSGGVRPIPIPTAAMGAPGGAKPTEPIQIQIISPPAQAGQNTPAGAKL